MPRGRPTLVCGGAGCGKTLLAAEFLVRGATQFGEPGVLMVFEETEAELRANVASLGFDLADLVRRQKILVEHIHIERSEIHETGEYDLEGSTTLSKWCSLCPAMCGVINTFSWCHRG